MTTRMQHSAFQEKFIYWALGLALFAGFAIGAHLISVIGFGFPLRATFQPYIQAHGQIQLIGWAGLFIIAISLHFIPRIAHVVNQKQGRQNLVLIFIVSGLLLRYLCQSYHAYLQPGLFYHFTNGLIVVGATLVFLGCALYVIMLISVLRQSKNTRLGSGAALKGVRPFFLMMLSGWLIYPAMVVALLTIQAFGQEISIDQSWNEISVQLFLYLTLLPIAMAFSIRLLPLFLRLPSVNWPSEKYAILYFLSVLLQTIPFILIILSPAQTFFIQWSALGSVLKAVLILTFIWKLDILTRRKNPWTVNRIGEPGADRRATRPGLPDYGEFGKFENLIYAAYCWLLFAALLEIASGAALLFDMDLPISSDAIRHAYLLGFISNLIFGIAPRMLPGLLKKKRIASPQLVSTTFWLLNLAAVSRVAPLLIPGQLVEKMPFIILISGIALGLSGMWGMAAIVCLWINLRKTKLA